MTTTVLTDTSKSFTSATRVTTSVLASAEKRALVAMARRLPAWVTSDQLTALALAAMAGVGLAYWLASITRAGLVLASVCLGLNWFGDSLDGTLARVRNCQRPRYGFYVDHVIDEFGVAFLFGGLALSGYMSPAVAALVLVVYLMLCVEVFLATNTLGEFRLSFLRIGPTELRLLLAAGNVVVMFHPGAGWLGHTWLLFDVGGVVAAIGLAAVLIHAAVRTTRTLYRLEPVPQGGQDARG